MKKLRNIAIYYIVLGLISVVLSFVAAVYVFEFLWPLFAIGIVLLIIYLLLNSNFDIKNNTRIISKHKLFFWNFLFYLHPILLILLVFWYYNKPYNQIIVLPRGYEGVVVIQYNRKDGQPKKWYGDSRIIKVDSKGYAKTQFGYDKLIEVFLYSEQLGQIKSNVTLDKMEIYYQDDFYNKIEQYYGGNVLDDQGSFKNQFIGFQTFFSWMNANEKETIFVVFDFKNYNKYFYTNSELKKLKINLENSNLSDSLRVEYQDQIKILQKK